jgi:hypothetical protein
MVLNVWQNKPWELSNFTSFLEVIKKTGLTGHKNRTALMNRI